METTTEKLPEWAMNEGQNALSAFSEYLANRRREIAGALGAGTGLDTWDPYLCGFAQGMRTGLEVAEDLVYSYMEWARRDVHIPDARASLQDAEDSV